MFVGRGVDFNGDGDNDLFIATKVRTTPITREEKEAWGTIFLWLLAAVFCVICFWVVAGLALLLHHEYTVLKATYETDSWEKQWMRLVAYAVVAILLRTSFIKLCRYLGSSLMVQCRSMQRILKRTPKESGAAKDDCFYCRRGNRVRGPLEANLVRAAIASGQLRDDDFIAVTASGPWITVSTGKKNYLL